MPFFDFLFIFLYNEFNQGVFNMKNYTLDKDTEFVLGYEVKKDKMHIRLANGMKKKVVTHSKEREELILAKMEEQVKSKKTKKFRKKMKKENKRNRTNLRMQVAIEIYAIMAVICVYLSPKSLVGVLVAIGTVAAIHIGEYVSTKRKLKDIKKNKFFIKHKDEINEGIKENSKDLTNILSNTSKRTQKLVTQTKDKEKPFDINVIDKLSYSQLIKLQNNIRQNKSFTEQIEILEKGRQKRK